MGEKIVDVEAYTKHSMEIMALKPLNLEICSPKKLEERCIKYFEICDKYNFRPTIAGFASAIGVTRQTLLKFINGERACPLDNYQVLERFYAMLNAMIETFMQEGTINNISGIFLMKNNFGYKDQTDYVVNNRQEDTIPEDKLIEEANLLTQGLPKLADFEELDDKNTEGEEQGA